MHHFTAALPKHVPGCPVATKFLSSVVLLSGSIGSVDVSCVLTVKLISSRKSHAFRALLSSGEEGTISQGLGFSLLCHPLALCRNRK